MYSTINKIWLSSFDIANEEVRTLPNWGYLSYPNLVEIENK